MAGDNVSRKIYQGNRPGEGWEFSTEFFWSGIRWEVYSSTIRMGRWVNLKIVADGTAEGKANYRLAWNGERLADNRDVRIMREFRPQMEKPMTTALMKT